MKMVLSGQCATLLSCCSKQFFPVRHKITPLILFVVICRYTNYGSQKAHDLAENPRASLLFFWDGLNRQVK